MESESFLNRCNVSGINPDIVLKEVSFSRANFILIHCHLESNFFTISGFADDAESLNEIAKFSDHYGSLFHDYIVCRNDNDYLTCYNVSVKDVKDSVLVNLCKNVADYLSIGEYAMLKKSYFIASAWFEKAKNSASVGADIIANY